MLPVEFNPTQIDACEPALKSYHYMSLSDYENGQEKHIHIVQLLTEALQVNFNFHFQQVSCLILFGPIQEKGVKCLLFCHFSVLWKNLNMMQTIYCN